MHVEIWRDAEVRAATKLSRTTIWRLEKSGRFPPRRRLTPNTVGWLSTDVESWIKSRVALSDKEGANE